MALTATFLSLKNNPVSWMKKSCKIVHVLYSGLGGHGNVFFSFVQANKNQGLVYEALFYGVEDVRDEYIARCEAAGVRWQFVKKRKKLDIAYYQQIRKALEVSDASIIFLHSGTLLLPAKLSNLFSRSKKSIIVRETQANHLKTKWEWLYLRLSLQFADKVVFLTEAYKTEVAQHFPSLMKRNNQKIHVIANGLDTEKFSPYQQKLAGTLVFAMQSRLVNIKDYPTLLHAFAQYLSEEEGRNAILKIAGDGPEKTYLTNLAEELNISGHVVFMGMLNEEELVAFLQSANIYIHATLGETMSTAIMQAMACGLPIIASDVKGVNNMITDGRDGLLVEVQNIGALKQKMEELAGNPILANELGSGAREKAVAEFSSATMANRYSIILQNFCES